MSSNKVDMSLDAIIALNSKGQRRGRGTGRGRGAGRGRGIGRGRGRGGVSVSRTPVRGARGLSRGRGVTRRGNFGRGLRQVGGRGGMQNIKNKQKQTAQQARQSLRNASFDSHRNTQTAQRGGATNSQGRKKLLRPTGQFQRGRGGARRGLGRGQRGQFIPQVTRGNLVSRGRRMGTRGRGRMQTIAATSVARAKRFLQSQRQQQNPRVIMRGGRKRMQHGQRGRDEARATTPLEDTKLQVSFSSPTMFEPEGVQLAFNFGASHHTQQSLNNRFTPPGSKKTVTRDRLILPNGRSVEYNS